MVCPQCGNNVPEGDLFCRVCGRGLSIVPGPPATSPLAPGAPPPTSGKAIASLVCGVFFFILPIAIAAIVLGHLSLSEIRKSAGRLAGHGMAVAGLVLGYLGVATIPLILIIAAIAIPNLLRARIAANEAGAVASLHTVNAAEETYRSDHPNAGYACSLSQLNRESLITEDLAKGTRNGYVLSLQNCSVDGQNERYQLVARPLQPNQTGVRVFCSDQTGVIRYDAAGSPEACLRQGSVLQ